MLDYSYEGDTNSVGANILEVETHLNQLRWPDHIEELLEARRAGKKTGNNVVHSSKESNRKNGSSQRDDELTCEDGKESNEDELGLNPEGAESDGEDLPVLPKVPGKRRLLNEATPQERRTQRGRAKSMSPQIKKSRTPQIDATVITQLQFGRRPPNLVSPLP